MEAIAVVSTNGKDARIAGEGQLSGGNYGAVTINGAGSIKGDVAASTFRINGAGNTDGSVKADVLVVNGSASFSREVQAAEMTVNGDASIAEGLGVSRLRVKGRLFVGGGLAALAVYLGTSFLWIRSQYRAAHALLGSLPNDAEDAPTEPVGGVGGAS